MRIALTGRPGSGKSMLFDLLEGKGGAPAPGLRIAHVVVPDPRVDALSREFKPKKTTPARIEFQDLEQKGSVQYPALSPERREMLSRADLVLLVVELFATPPEEWAEEARRQIAELADEFLILDLATVEGRLERVQKIVKAGQKPGFTGEPELLERLRATLDEGRPVRSVPEAEEKAKELRGFAFLSGRPILAAFNVGEEQLGDARGLVDAIDLSGVLQPNETEGSRIVFSAEVENQILEIPEDERASFMEAFGLEESAVAQTIRAAYERAGLESFFTVGEDEVRAWSVRKGSFAPQAAGAIHSDLEKGFVRAEVVAFADWESAGSMSAAKEKKLVRMEGKDYVIQDGDIVNIRSGLAKSRG
ncbi:MAG: DUF933 domain-containing protein [Candidatus Eisenbacteria bacterium]